MVESPVTLTNVSGIHAIPISEFVIGLMLMFVKQAPFCFQLKCEKKWERFTPEALNSKTVGIVGLGSIGREVARLAKAFGMRVMATRRSARQVGHARYVDIMLPPEQLNRLLAESDFVVLAVPFTPETSNLIGRKELRKMRPTACLINIARGGIVDEAALVRALEEHWIAGAGLDVFATEPLPADSRLWELPNVIFSPHIAGGLGDYAVRATEIFAENLKRYLAGKRLLNVVDKKRGY
jgi:phosphoglycerate dehydrogenase-like enzyme